MARLIDAKAFDLRVSQKKMSEVFPNWKELPQEVQDAVCKHAQHLHMLLETQPTVDAVEVVRCKDCEHFEQRFGIVGDATGKVYCGGYCYRWDYEPGMSPNQVDGDDFCSYGERRADHG